MSNSKTQIFSPELISHLKVVELRAELRRLGQPVSGRKSVLQQRLRLARAALAKPPVSEPESPVTPPAAKSASEDVMDSITRLLGMVTPTTPSWSPAEPETSPSTPTTPPAKRPSPKRALFPSDEEEAENGENMDVEDGETTPRPIIRQPGSEKKRQRISFGHIEVRKYSVIHGGSLSTPSKGAFPLGLDWEYDEEAVERKPLREYEEEKQITPKHLRRLNETQRKLLLERMDKRSYFEKQASWETEKEDLRQIRRSRCNVGCGCTSPGACGTRRCLCVREGLSCNDDSCRCTDINCNNHLRYNFDQSRVDQYRRQKIMLAPYTEREDQQSNGWATVGAWAYE